MKTIIQFWIVSGLALCTLTTTSPTKAQIVPDATLPHNSNVTPEGNTSVITGGTAAGSNLFHSFEQFSLPTESAAFFNNATDIQNIISRVTGASISNIDGLIQANGTANLFLINPNGIIFGPNATLNIGGSFLGSTATSLNFADGSSFSATAHPSTPLLTVSVPIGLQFGGSAGNILNQSQATNSNGQLVGLQVLSGKSLALVGGEVRLEGGRLEAPGGRVELGGLAGAGTVGLSVDSNNLLLSFPDDVARADVYLTNNGSNITRINVAASNGGSIGIAGRNVDISGDSELLAGIATGLGFPGAQAGDIKINATGAITVANSSLINRVGNSPAQSQSGVEEQGTVGNGGNIDITTGSLFVTNGAQMSTRTGGQGNAGDITIRAISAVSFDGQGILQREETADFSRASSNVREGAFGNAGNIDITTGSLSVTSGALLGSNTRGQGNAGNVTIRGDTVSFDGEGILPGDDGPEFSRASSTVREGAFGNAGNIDITTGSLSVTDGAQLNTISAGLGNAGNINIKTGSLLVTNGAQLDASKDGGQGNAGNVTIDATDTVVFDGVNRDVNERAQAISRVNQPGDDDRVTVGNGGDIDITARSLSVRNGAQLNTITEGQGNAGNITIRAIDTVSFEGEGIVRGEENGPVLVFSRADTNVRGGAVGNAGDIDITTGSLFVTNGASLGTATRGLGNAGNITIRGDTVSFAGVGTTQNSRAISRVENGGVGNGGKLDITTRSLSVTDGAQLIADTRGQGNAGNVTIRAIDTVSFDGQGSILQGGRNVDVFSGALSSVENRGVGNGGKLDITAGSLFVTNRAQLSATSAGNGAAGNIEVVASSIRLDNFASLSSDTIAGQGNIILNSEDLVLRRGSNITTDATGTATGGNITIDTDNLVALENSDIEANAVESFGGKVIINAQGIFGTQFRERETPESDITAISAAGSQFSGIVELNTPEVDPSQGLVTLPAELVDASNQIAASCAADADSVARNTFIITGRGGLPPSPNEPLNSETVLTNWATLESDAEDRSGAAPSPDSTRVSAPTTIVEAQGWTINNKGEVILTAQAPTVTPHSPWTASANCHAPENSS